MGAIEDVRKVIQDLVTPDLKALAARLDAHEKTMGLQLGSMEKSFAALLAMRDTALDARLDSMEKSANAKIDVLTAQLELIDMNSKLRDDSIMVRLDALSNKIDSNHASLLYALTTDKRLEAIERDRHKELMSSV